MDPPPYSAPPRFDTTSGPLPNARDGVRRSTPAWDREQLIRQFQRIDGSTRIEAERQITDFERSFRSGIAESETLQTRPV